MFAIQDMLKSIGHEIFPFSVKSKNNRPCEYEQMFLSPVADDSSVYFAEYKKDVHTMLKVLARQVYSAEAYVKARKFAAFCRPDLVYSLQFMSKMSPSVLDGFKSVDVPVVLRVSDFSMICPQGHLFDGKDVCNACVSGNLSHAISRRCIMNSRVAGFVKAGALSIHRLLGCRNRIDAYVFPSQFTMDKFIEAGFPRNKLHCIPTPVETTNVSPQYSSTGPILYFGRVVREKGVHQLLEAYSSLLGNKPGLNVIGVQRDMAYSKELMDRYTDVAFYDFIERKELARHIANALCVVIPSVWYDNLPNALLEAYSYGKPVIAPRHGSFVDLIRDGRTGLFYDPGNVGSLKNKLEWAIANPLEMREMGRRARQLAETEFSSARHLDKLCAVFESTVRRGRRVHCGF